MFSCTAGFFYQDVIIVDGLLRSLLLLCVFLLFWVWFFCFWGERSLLYNWSCLFFDNWCFFDNGRSFFSYWSLLSFDLWSWCLFDNGVIKDFFLRFRSLFFWSLRVVIKVWIDWLYSSRWFLKRRSYFLDDLPWSNFELFDSLCVWFNFLLFFVDCLNLKLPFLDSPNLDFMCHLILRNLFLSLYF